jgi:lipid-binding SYLF domain-containing protein
MKKLLILSLVALFASAVARADTSRPEAINRIDSCEAIIREFQARPETRIPANVLQRAKALIILNQFRAGFFFGIKDGYGVIMVRHADNSWSLPVLVRAGEASFGLQVGANSVETIYVVTDANIPKTLFNSRFNIGVDAKAIIGPHEASKERYKEEILRAPMLAYTRAVGAFVGASVKAGYITRDDELNMLLYQTQYKLPELLYGDFVQPKPEVLPLMRFVQQIAP